MILGVLSLSGICAGLGGGADPALVEWYEQASAYYNAVMSGSEAKPSQSEWKEFLDQYNWAKQQLGGQGGGKGTAIHRSPKVRLSFVGVGGTHDIWSNDVTIAVTSVSARVSCEITVDTRTQPPEKVVKIVVTDPATGATAIYFVHDYEDASINVKTPKPGQVTGCPLLKTTLLVVRKPGFAPGRGIRVRTPTPTRPARP